MPRTRLKINTGLANPDAVRSEVLRTLHAVGHRGRTSIDILGGSPRYSAHTTIVDKAVEMKLDPDQNYIAKEKRLLSFLQKKGLAEPLLGLGNALARHEAAHTGADVEGKTFGCPGTIENHYEIFMEMIIRALSEKGKGAGAAGYVANIIQDLIDNYACQKIGSMDGDMLFMYEQGLAKGEYTKIYEAFSKLYAFINGQRDWNRLLKPFYTNDKKVNEAVSSIVKELGLKRGMCDSLLETGNWKQIAHTMAYHLADLIEFDGAGQVIIKQQLPGGMHDVEPAPPTLAYERYVKGMPLPLYMEADDALWDIYWELAGRTDIIAEGELKTQDLPIIPLRYRQFDAEKDDPADIDPFMPVMEGDTMDFGVADYKMSLPIPLKESREGYPSVNIALLDRSISMLEDVAGGSNTGSKATIPWGAKSKYHYLYLGAVSIVKGAYEKNILDQVDFGGLFFGSTTDHVSGLESLKKALSKQEFQGSTRLDIGKIRDSLGDEPSVFMTISDGSIHNWAEVKEEFMKTVSGHYFFHIQIGEETDMTRDLRNAGFKVVRVNSGENLVKNMATITLQIMDEHSKRRDY
jgi:hypothetical protein